MYIQKLQTIINNAVLIVIIINIITIIVITIIIVIIIMHRWSQIASQITSVTIVYSTVCSDPNQRKHQSSASRTFVRRIHRWPLDSPHKAEGSNAENVSIWWRHHIIAIRRVKNLISPANLSFVWPFSLVLCDRRSLRAAPNHYLNQCWLIIQNGLLRTIDRDIFNLWWRHQMEKISALLAICAGNSPVTKANDAELWCFFYLHLNKRLSKQSWGWWFETPSRSLWSL